MRRITFFLFLALILCEAMARAENPAATLNCGQVQIAAAWERAWFNADVQRTGSAGLNINVATATAEVGLLPQRLSLFTGSGAGEIRLDGFGIDGSLREFWRLGLHSTIWRSGSWQVGLDLDARHYRASDGTDLAGHPFRTNLDLWHFQVRPAVAWTRNAITLYAGPSLTWLDGAMDFEWGSPMGRLEFLTKAKVGLFAGGTYQIIPHLALAVEGQTSEMGQAVSVGITGRF